MNSTKKRARIAGLLYLLASIIGFPGLIYVPGKLIESEDATATANHIRASETLLRFGIASELTSFIIFIFVVLALYRLFKTVSEKYAVAMATLLLVSILSRFSMCSTKSLRWSSSAVPVSFQHSKRVSWTPWPTCSFVCMARDSSLRKSSGGFGYFRSGFLSFDPVSSPASWASCCSLQVPAIWPVPSPPSFCHRTGILLTNSRWSLRLGNCR